MKSQGMNRSLCVLSPHPSQASLGFVWARLGVCHRQVGFDLQIHKRRSDFLSRKMARWLTCFNLYTWSSFRTKLRPGQSGSFGKRHCSQMLVDWQVNLEKHQDREVAGEDRGRRVLEGRTLNISLSRFHTFHMHPHLFLPLDLVFFVLVTSCCSDTGGPFS